MSFIVFFHRRDETRHLVNMLHAQTQRLDRSGDRLTPDIIFALIVDEVR
ncbi:MAG: hypothetical protein OXF79_09115 [Chloroflexi bacterium]|nr:hypothetical protein [Chloroflexota bacterium]